MDVTPAMLAAMEVLRRMSMENPTLWNAVQVLREGGVFVEVERTLSPHDRVS